jgi:hypothetical protein
MSNSTFVSGTFSRLDAALTKNEVFRPSLLPAVGHAAGSLGLGILSQDPESARSGFLTWLQVCECGYRRDAAPPSLMVERMRLFPSSGDIYCKVQNPLTVLQRIKTLHATWRWRSMKRKVLGWC